jgi:hypothetical protein
MNRMAFIGLAAMASLAGCMEYVDETDEFANEEDETITNPENGLDPDWIRSGRPILFKKYHAGLRINRLSWNSWENGMRAEYCPSDLWKKDSNGRYFNTDAVKNDAIMQKIVECAFSNTQSFTRTCTTPSGAKRVYTFRGRLAMASEWATKSCDDTCQKKVSACVIALSNRETRHVKIDLAGVVNNPPDPAFTQTEAAYWGNIFLDTPFVNGCAGPDADKTYYDGSGTLPNMSRVCYGYAAYGTCLSQDALDMNGNLRYHLDNLTSDKKVKSCDVVCTKNANGVYSPCGSNYQIITVRRNPAIKGTL